MLTTSHSTVTAVVATRAVGHVNEGELAIGVARILCAKCNGERFEEEDDATPSLPEIGNGSSGQPERASLCAGLTGFDLDWIEWPAHLRRRPAPTPFEKGWVAFLKATTTAADLRRMERLTRRSEGCRKTSTKTLEGKTAVTSAALKKPPPSKRSPPPSKRSPPPSKRSPPPSKRSPPPSKRSPPPSRRRPTPSKEGHAVQNNPAVAPNPGSHRIPSDPDWRWTPKPTESRRVGANERPLPQTQDEPMEIEEGQATQQSEKTSQARSITEPERVRQQPWPQTPSSALEFLSLLTPTGHKRPATTDGGLDSTPKRRTFDRPSRRRAAVVAPPASANAGTFVHPAGMRLRVGDDVLQTHIDSGITQMVDVVAGDRLAVAEDPWLHDDTLYHILLQQIWTYNQAHADQQAALLNPLFWVRRIFAPNYDRAGNIVQPQMTADERANYFATADTQLTLARNTFRRVVVPINVPGHWLLAMIDIFSGEIHIYNSLPNMDPQLEKLLHESLQAIGRRC
ncbi:hypothetical protein L596_030693 [Steinernema carpocapsae]|uniref:Uncharacterized protein n=1 Tax=Steinernema carpocapsae TaxID=34508 RepID=A0A4U5LNG5_STECR|nr:hypothetical protein L596_030693 [Steinernema carpocapsae]